MGRGGDRGGGGGGGEEWSLGRYWGRNEWFGK